MELVPAGEIIRGGALGYLKSAAGIGRRKRNAAGDAKNCKWLSNYFQRIFNPYQSNSYIIDIIDKIIDLSTFDNKDEMILGKSPEYITEEKVLYRFCLTTAKRKSQVCNYDSAYYGVLVSLFSFEILYKL